MALSPKRAFGKRSGGGRQDAFGVQGFGLSRPPFSPIRFLLACPNLCPYGGREENEPAMSPRRFSGPICPVPRKLAWPGKFRPGRTHRPGFGTSGRMTAPLICRQFSLPAPGPEFRQRWNRLDRAAVGPPIHHTPFAEGLGAGPADSPGPEPQKWTAKEPVPRPGHVLCAIWKRRLSKLAKPLGRSTRVSAARAPANSIAEIRKPGT